MGWSFPWVSCGDQRLQLRPGLLVHRRAGERVRRAACSRAGAPPILDANAAASGTDVAGYLTEGPGFSSFAKDDGVVYHTYSTQARGLEFLMGYYPILDRAPKGRDEGGGMQLWLRRHDEYGN